MTTLSQRNQGRLSAALQNLEAQTSATQRNFAMGWNSVIQGLMVPGAQGASPSDTGASAEPGLPQQPPPAPPPETKKNKRRQHHIETDMGSGGDDGPRSDPQQQTRPAEEQEPVKDVPIDTIYSRRDFERRQSLTKTMRDMEDFQQSLPSGSPILESAPVLAFCQLARFYALTQGCFLTVFITQKCPTLIDPVLTTSPLVNYERVWRNNNACNFDWLPPGHLCSIEETVDWTNMGTHTKGVFIINCITFSFAVAVELFLWVRERWVKKHFREDKTKAYSLFQVQLQQQHALFEEFQKMRRRPHPAAGEPPDPAVLQELAVMDKQANQLAYGVLFLCCGNLVASSQYLLKDDRRFSYRTGMHLLAYTLLIAWDVMNLLRLTARGPRTENLALSMLVREPISYNIFTPPEEPEQSEGDGGDGEGVA